MALPVFNPPRQPSSSSNKPEFKVLKADFGDGYTQSTPDGMNNVRKMLSLSWEWLTDVEAQAIEDFIVARKGAEIFLYRPTGSPTALKWTCDDFTRKQGTPNTVELVLRQSFALV